MGTVTVTHSCENPIKRPNEDNDNPPPPPTHTHTPPPTPPPPPPPNHVMVHHAARACPPSHRPHPHHTSTAPATISLPINRQPQWPDTQWKELARPMPVDTRAPPHLPHYLPDLMDIPTQPPRAPSGFHTRGSNTNVSPNASIPGKDPSHAPTVPPNTQCQLCLSWGHSAVVRKSRHKILFVF